MLDTNTISYIARNRSPEARRRFKEAEYQSPVYVSAISEAEVRYGLAKRPQARLASETMPTGCCAHATNVWALPLELSIC
jgi:predicted nucleic acid-binding protein